MSSLTIKRKCDALGIDLPTNEELTIRDLKKTIDLTAKMFREKMPEAALKKLQEAKENFEKSTSRPQVDKYQLLEKNEPQLHLSNSKVEDVRDGLDALESFLELNPIHLPNETVSDVKAQLSDRYWSTNKLPLGKGGNGTAILTISPSGRKCVKKINSNLTTNGWEAVMLGALSHPNIPKIFGINRLKNELIIEYAENGDMANYIITHQMLPEHFKYLFYQLASTLAYMHTNGFIHGDLKLENIVMTADFKIKLIDFGSANLKENYPNLWMRGTTPYISAPEIIDPSLCDKDRLDSPDVWAFAVTLYRGFTNNFLYSDGKELYDRAVKEVGMGIIFNPEECALLSKGGASDEAIDLMQKCLQFEPKDRPTMDQILKHPFFFT